MGCRDLTSGTTRDIRRLMGWFNPRSVMDEVALRFLWTSGFCLLCTSVFNENFCYWNVYFFSNSHFWGKQNINLGIWWCIWSDFHLKIHFPYVSNMVLCCQTLSTTILQYWYHFISNVTCFHATSFIWKMFPLPCYSKSKLFCSQNQLFQLCK